jgi:membrane fusion protein, copper/silver efflux system
MSPDNVAGPPRGVRTMSIVRWLLVVVTAVVAVGSILGYLNHTGVHRGGGASAPAGQVYYCPMHPSVVRDHPGECPICSMTLVRKPEQPAKPGDPTTPAATASATGLAEVVLTPERIQLIGMRTAIVKREALGGELRTVGVVAANERGLAQINTRFSGWLQKLLVSETGEHVRRGQVLATIYSPDVLRAEQELLVAHGWNTASPSGQKLPGAHEHDDFASGLAANARGRLELLGISSPEIDEILRTGKASEAIAIRSPVDGYVVGKNAVVGVAVQPGTVLFEVADLSQVWVTADVYEQDIARVKVGQRARLELSSFPGELHAGKVSFIYPTLDAANRTLRLRLEFKNRSDRSGPRLRPGMYGTVYLDLPSTTGLMLPAEAVVDTGETHYLFVAKEGGRFEPRAVKVGARLKDKLEILGGVTEGETVVTTGNFLVDSESRLRAAIEGQPSRIEGQPSRIEGQPSRIEGQPSRIDGQPSPERK